VKLEKLCLKKVKCWMFICVKCKQSVEEGEYIPHFNTKREALEHLDDKGGEDYFSPLCACWNEELK